MANNILVTCPKCGKITNVTLLDDAAICEKCGKAFIVKNAKNAYSSQDFVVVDNRLIQYNGNKSLVIVPEGIICVGKEAFCNNKTLKKLILPDSLLRIEDKAFFNCKKLEDIEMPNTIRYFGECCFSSCENLFGTIDLKHATYIGEHAFYNCKNLDEIKMPDYIEEIKRWTFGGCDYTLISHIPQGVKIIGEFAFANCNFENIILPNSLVELASNAFYEIRKASTSQKPMVIDIPCSCRNIGSTFRALDYSDNIRLNVYEDCIIDANQLRGLQALIIKKNDKADTPGDFGCYNGCIRDKISTIIIEDGVRFIPKGAFAEMSKIENIYLPDSVVYIGDYAFNHCQSLVEINFPNPLKDIGEYAFEKCASLKKITLGNNIKKIPFACFANVKNYQLLIGAIL